MLRNQVINKEIRPGDGIFCFECSIDEYLESTLMKVPNINKDGISISNAANTLINSSAKRCPSSDGSSNSAADAFVLKLYTFSDKGAYCYDQNHYIEYMLLPITLPIAPPT